MTLGDSDDAPHFFLSHFLLSLMVGEKNSLTPYESSEVGTHDERNTRAGGGCAEHVLRRPRLVGGASGHSTPIEIFCRCKPAVQLQVTRETPLVLSSTPLVGGEN